LSSQNGKRVVMTTLLSRHIFVQLPRDYVFSPNELKPLVYEYTTSLVLNLFDSHELSRWQF